MGNGRFTIANGVRRPTSSILIPNPLRASFSCNEFRTRSSRSRDPSGSRPREWLRPQGTHLIASGIECYVPDAFECAWQSTAPTPLLVRLSCGSNKCHATFVKTFQPKRPLRGDRLQCGATRNFIRCKACGSLFELIAEERSIRFTPIDELKKHYPNLPVRLLGP
jgi:hypothetical protein